MSKKSISNDTRPGKIDGPQISREKHDRNSNTGLGRLILLLWWVSAWLHSHLAYFQFYLESSMLSSCILYLTSNLYLVFCIFYLVSCNLHFVSCILYLASCILNLATTSCTMTFVFSVLILLTWIGNFLSVPFVSITALYTAYKQYQMSRRQFPDCNLLYQ